jgi:hypothetical protein
LIRQRRFVTLSSFHHLFFRSQLNADTKPHILTRNWRDSETKLADKTGEKKEIDLGDMRRQSLLPNVSVTHFYPLSSFSPLGYCNTFQSLDRDEWLCLSTQSTLTCLSFSISVCLLVFMYLCVFLFHLCLPVSLSFSVFFTTSICAPDCLTFLFVCLCLSFFHCFTMIWFSFLCLSVCVFANVDLFRKSEYNNAPL